MILKLPAYEGVIAQGLASSLRPSLRAATSLARHDSFSDLPRKVADFHLGAIRGLILATATDKQAANAFIEKWDEIPLFSLKNSLELPLLALIAGFVPASTDTKSDQPKGNPVPWPEFYSRLFQTATGWLGWTPETAWQATPSEISEAFIGHIARLKAIHGAGDEKADHQADIYDNERLQQIDELGFDPAFDKAGLRALKDSIARER